MASSDKINNVVICGGTHGNELSGVYLVKKWMSAPTKVQRSSFNTDLILCNTKAIDACTRYADTDLNRCFSETLLNADVGENPAYETIRAKELEKQICGQKRNTKADFVLDLHNTTANMGVCVIVLDAESPFMKAMLKSLSDIPGIIFYYYKAERLADPHMMSMGKYGVTLEVGPLAHGTLRADLFKQTEEVVHKMLDFMDKWNAEAQAIQALPKKTLDLYLQDRDVDYPRNDEGSLNGMIHPSLNGNDYCKLEKGSPLFVTFDGEVIPYDGEEPVWPLFINEAAYLEKKFAMSFTTKQRVTY